MDDGEYQIVQVCVNRRLFGAAALRPSWPMHESFVTVWHLRNGMTCGASHPRGLLQVNETHICYPQLARFRQNNISVLEWSFQTIVVIMDNVSASVPLKSQPNTQRKKLNTSITDQTRRLNINIPPSLSSEQGSLCRYTCVWFQGFHFEARMSPRCCWLRIWASIWGPTWMYSSGCPWYGHCLSGKVWNGKDCCLCSCHPPPA